MSRAYDFRNDLDICSGYWISILTLRPQLFLKIYSTSFQNYSGISYIAFSLTALFIYMDSFKEFLQELVRVFKERKEIDFYSA